MNCGNGININSIKEGKEKRELRDNRIEGMKEGKETRKMEEGE